MRVIEETATSPVIDSAWHLRKIKLIKKPRNAKDILTIHKESSLREFEGNFDNCDTDVRLNKISNLYNR